MNYKFRLFFLTNISYAFICVSHSQVKREKTKGDFLDVIEHYQKEGDSLKVIAAQFLVDNINLHQSVNCSWYDANGEKSTYEELSFEDYTKAKEVLTNIRQEGATYKIDTIADSKKITSDLLIENIDLAFKAWRTNPWSKTYSFDVFKEYILPYRSTNEPLQNWRDDYKWFYDGVRIDKQGVTDPIDVCKALLKRNTSFKFKFIRKDPLPILGPKHILFRNEGNCHEIANLNIYASRTLGIATTFDFVPFWAASSNRHMWNTTIDGNGKHIAYDSERLTFITKKRIAKVLRYTFSEQTNALASKIDPEIIPSYIFGKKNIIDVTNEYTAVGEFNYTFQDFKEGYAYLCVFNRGNWEITDWVEVTNFKAKFQNLGKDVIYLPATSLDNKISYERTPILLSNTGDTHFLAPDLGNVFNCRISRSNETLTEYEEENSTEIKEGQKYHLVYWDKKWIYHASAIAVNDGVQFKSVPSNALFALLTDKTDGYERVFTINTQNEKITWY